MTHIVAPNLTGGIGEAVGMFVRCGKQQQARCFNGIAGDADDAGLLPLLFAVLVEIHHAGDLAAVQVDRGDRRAARHVQAPAGGVDRLVQLLFVSGDVDAATDRVQAWTAVVEADGTATLLLAAPFLHTVVGTDTYVDQL